MNGGIFFSFQAAARTFQVTLIFSDVVATALIISGGSSGTAAKANNYHDIVKLSSIALLPFREYIILFLSFAALFRVGVEGLESCYKIGIHYMKLSI